MNKIPQRLSETAIQEFRDIYQDEFDEVLTDAEAAQRAFEVLRLFKIIADDLPTKTTDPISLSEDELKALQYIQRCLAGKTEPTVRGIAQAIGRHSSRSGYRMLQGLINRGVVYRDENSDVRLML